MFDATFTPIKQSRKLCNKGSKIMLQQQIKAENTVQIGSQTRSNRENIAPSFVNTGCTSNSYVKPHLSPPYCHQTTKVPSITIESEHNQQQE
ncbi:MAG: hypothetical protein ACFNVK_00300 [Prevotella sp.]